MSKLSCISTDGRISARTAAATTNSNGLRSPLRSMMSKRGSQAGAPSTNCLARNRARSDDSSFARRHRGCRAAQEMIPQTLGAIGRPRASFAGDPTRRKRYYAVRRKTQNWKRWIAFQGVTCWCGRASINSKPSPNAALRLAASYRLTDRPLHFSGPSSANVPMMA